MPDIHHSAEAKARNVRVVCECPRIAWWPGKIAANSWNYDIVGGLDFMATFASLAGVPLPDKDREGQRMMFDSYDMTPVFLGIGPCPRNEWYYFTVQRPAA